MIKEACARLTGDLSEEVWRQYFDNEPYVPVCRGLRAR
jgi:hypothetical protein